MKENNVFHQLQEENEVAFNIVEHDIKRNVESRRGVWAFIGSIIDLYVPKVLETLLSGGTLPTNDNRISSGDQ